VERKHPGNDQFQETKVHLIPLKTDNPFRHYQGNRGGGGGTLGLGAGLGFPGTFGFGALAGLGGCFGF
jgi:hypothetical protein